MGLRRVLALSALITGIGTSGLTVNASAAALRAAQSPRQANASGISVRGSQLLRDGVPWRPRGVQIVGIVAPQGSLTGKYAAAHAHFSAAELQAAVADHADLVRFQVSEFGLDPEDPLYSPAYVQEVQSAVQTARSLGLAVIVSLQAEPPAGEPTRCPLPDAGAERDWNELAPMFAADRGVMFELYNEPALGPSASGWETWLNGGPVANSPGSCQAVGMQTLIDDIRTDGASNVIIVPGLAGEKTLGGMPPPFDPLDLQDPQIAYGVHYPALDRGIGAWNFDFGNASGSVPVILTEWNASSMGTNCLSDTPTDAQLLLDYLASKQIPLVGFAFDVPGSIIADWSYAPTGYQDFTCGVPGDGPGQLLFGDYATEAHAGAGAPAWIVSSTVVKRLAAVAPNMTSDSFSTPWTFVTGASSNLLNQLSVPEAIPTASFADENTLAAAVRQGRLPVGTRAVVYDDEAWKLTPRNQQLHPRQYYQRAAQVAHKHDLMLIAAPGLDLAGVIVPHAKNAVQQRAQFLRLRIAAAAAHYADVLEIQAQSDEMNTKDYSRFVRSVKTQAVAAHPGVELLAGISTNPQGRKQSSSVLLGAALATRSTLSGYALNDPSPGKWCPLCTGPYPGVVRSFLRRLAAITG